MDRYVVKLNHCDCHPETCCCNPFKLVDIKTGKKIATNYSKKDAEELCRLLNKANQ